MKWNFFFELRSFDVLESNASLFITFEYFCLASKIAIYDKTPNIFLNCLNGTFQFENF